MNQYQVKSRLRAKKKSTSELVSSFERARESFDEDMDSTYLDSQGYIDDMIALAERLLKGSKIPFKKGHC